MTTVAYTYKRSLLTNCEKFLGQFFSAINSLLLTIWEIHLLHFSCVVELESNPECSF